MNVVSARAAALRILAARAAFEDDPRSTAYTLAEFQRQAVSRAHAIIQARGGVMIADDVGLGKTYIGATLLERYLESGQAVAVVTPASLKTAWRRALRPLVERDGGIDVITHGQLSRGLMSSRLYAVVVVDEAHAFRNPRTRRYRALRRLVRASPLILLTATPVNNSLSDLYFQIRLFAGDDAFTDLGIGSLSAVLRADEIDRAALARLRDAVVIRRTRAQLRTRSSVIELPDGQRLRFPGAVQLSNVLHAPVIGVPEIELLLKRARFAAYRSEATATLISLSLLKRLQSGRHAGLASLDRLIGFHQRFLEALGQGRLLQAQTTAHSAEQLCFSEVLLPALPRGLDARELSAGARQDLAVLREFKERLAGVADTKLPALIDLLTARPPPHRTVVFTEFCDTAAFLWRALRNRFQVGLVTGSEAFLGGDRSPRGEVIRRFAPLSNQSRLPAYGESVFVLIATDVLAEGLNLQDADAVVSYDLPWNPVRLIQRAGRIDRIGSPHDRVTVYNFIPDHQFDDLLGLVRRLRDKLRGIRAAVSHQTPVLEPHEITASFYEESGDPPAAFEVPRPTDFAEAGPEGCTGSTTAAPRRVLTSWRLGRIVRELIIQDNRIMDDKEAADQILQRALESTRVEAPAAVLAAVEAARAYLPTGRPLSAAVPEIALLARAIQRAVQVYGILAKPDLLAEADAVLEQIHGNVFEPSQLTALRSARTVEDLRRVLHAIRLNCRTSPDLKSRNWRLVAALGTD